MTAIDDADRAARIARLLVERRLAACVQVLGPVTSTYRWEGRIETASEHLLLIKTSAPAYEGCAAALADLHPYDTPEIIATPIVAGLAGYLDWIGQETERS